MQVSGRQHLTTPQVSIEGLGLEDASVVLPQLRPLLDNAYHNSHMYDDLKEDISEAPDPFRLFLASTSGAEEERTAVGSAVVERKVHTAFDYLGLAPIHIKRFTVLDAFRSMRIGKQLIDACKDFGFKEEGFSAMFVESNEIGALSMYGREGALYSREAIEEYYRRNTPGDALCLFGQALNDRSRRHERYPNGEGIRFVFAKNDETADFFRSNGYVALEELTNDVA
jgi:ribosomal protein S18 acetylase RimI-like enzyme